MLLMLLLGVGVMYGQNKTDAQGKKQGAWTKYYSDGKTLFYTGQFKDDLPYGEFRYYYPSGKVKTILRHEAKNRTYAWFYFETEKLMSEGAFLNMKKDSLWKSYNTEGYLLSTEHFKNNMLDGEKRNYYILDQAENGAIKCSSIETYKDSVLNGPCYTFLSSGIKVNEGNYLNGLKEGVWKSFHADGSLASKMKYKAGKAVGYSYAYDETGEEIYKAYWLNGEKLTNEERIKYFEMCSKKGIIPEE